MQHKTITWPSRDTRRGWHHRSWAPLHLSSRCRAHQCRRQRFYQVDLLRRQTIQQPGHAQSVCATVWQFTLVTAGSGWSCREWIHRRPRGGPACGHNRNVLGGAPACLHTPTGLGLYGAYPPLFVKKNAVPCSDITDCEVYREGVKGILKAVWRATPCGAHWRECDCARVPMRLPRTSLIAQS